MLKILSATVQNLVGRATRCLVFLHSCATVPFAECDAVVSCFLNTVQEYSISREMRKAFNVLYVSKRVCKKGSLHRPLRPKGKQRCSSTLSLALALEGGGGWLASRPGCFTPWKETRYPLYRRLGGPQGRSGRVPKILPPPRFDPGTVQPVASRYTDSAIPAHKRVCSLLKIKFLAFYAI
jgi:hypothetical protein